MTRINRSELKANTMACWWPSAINPAVRPDWRNIAAELTSAADGAITCRDNQSEADEYLRLASIATAEYDRLYIGSH